LQWGRSPRRIRLRPEPCPKAEVPPCAGSGGCPCPLSQSRCLRDRVAVAGCSRSPKPIPPREGARSAQCASSQPSAFTWDVPRCAKVATGQSPRQSGREGVAPCPGAARPAGLVPEEMNPPCDRLELRSCNQAPPKDRRSVGDRPENGTGPDRRHRCRPRPVSEEVLSKETMLTRAGQRASHPVEPTIPRARYPCRPLRPLRSCGPCLACGAQARRSRRPASVPSRCW